MKVFRSAFDRTSLSSTPMSLPWNRILLLLSYIPGEKATLFLLENPVQKPEEGLWKFLTILGAVNILTPLIKEYYRHNERRNPCPANHFRPHCRLIRDPPGGARLQAAPVGLGHCGQRRDRGLAHDPDPHRPRRGRAGHPQAAPARPRLHPDHRPPVHLHGLRVVVRRVPDRHLLRRLRPPRREPERVLPDGPPF